MNRLLDFLWDNHFLFMAGAYLVLLVLVIPPVSMIWAPRNHADRSNVFAVAPLAALVPWLAVKVLVHEHFGGLAVAIAERMPPEHPQIEVFNAAREAYDIAGLNQWANFNRNPVDAGVIVKTQAALSSLPSSTFKTQLQEELATGYLGQMRFEAAALSIIQISVKELGQDPALLELIQHAPKTSIGQQTESRNFVGFQ